MDRINSANTTDIGGGKRGFKDENIVAGTAGTDVSAAHMNASQEEVLKVIEEAGLVPDGGDWTQLWQALSIMFGQLDKNIHVSKLSTQFTVPYATLTTIPFDTGPACNFATFANGVYTFTEPGDYDVFCVTVHYSPRLTTLSIMHNPVAGAEIMITSDGRTHRHELTTTFETSMQIAATVRGVAVGDTIRLGVFMDAYTDQLKIQPTHSAHNLETQLIIVKKGI